MKNFTNNKCNFENSPVKTIDLEDASKLLKDCYEKLNNKDAILMISWKNQT